MPVMAGEFLLLMVFLDKFWFGPVGATLDARDKELRGKLGMVKDNGSAVGAACWAPASGHYLLGGCCRWVTGRKAMGAAAWDWVGMAATCWCG